MSQYPVQTTGWMATNNQISPANQIQNSQQTKQVSYGKSKVGDSAATEGGADAKKRRVAQSKSFKNIQMHNNLIEDSKNRENSNNFAKVDQIAEVQNTV